MNWTYWHFCSNFNCINFIWCRMPPCIFFLNIAMLCIIPAVCNCWQLPRVQPQRGPTLARSRYGDVEIAQIYEKFLKNNFVSMWLLVPAKYSQNISRSAKNQKYREIEKIKIPKNRTIIHHFAYLHSKYSTRFLGTKSTFFFIWTFPASIHLFLLCLCTSMTVQSALFHNLFDYFEFFNPLKSVTSHMFEKQ